MSNEANAIISQAKSEARNQNIKNFFTKNSKLIVLVAIVATVALIGHFAFQAYQKSQQAKYSEILHRSLLNQQIGNIAEAKANLREIYEAKSAPDGVRSLASLRYAALLLEEGNKEEAAKIYLEVSQCNSCDEYVRNLAGLLTVKTWMSDEVELQKPDLSERIEKVETGLQLLRYYATEQRALLEMARNNLEKSYQIFELISKNPESSKNLKERAKDYLKMIKAKGFEPQVEVKTEEKIEEKAAVNAAEKTEVSAEEKVEEKK